MPRFVESLRSTFIIVLLAMIVPGMNRVASGQSQVAGGMIQGTVTDASGAAVPSMEIEIRNAATGLTRTVTTNEEGRYTAPLLPVGAYTVRASRSGFATVEVKGVVLTVGASPVVNIVMEVSAVAQEVTVMANAELIEPTESNSKTTVNERAIHELPILARDFRSFLALTPGVLQAQTQTSQVGLQVAGQKSITVQFNIDGADFNNHFFGGQTGGVRPPFIFSQEAIKEFVVLTNGFNAEFGRSAGVQLNAVTRSGTNDIHGSFWYFHQDHSFVADDALGNPPLGVRKQTGATIGGPVLKNKLFYFGDVDFQRRTAPANLIFDGQSVLQEAAASPVAARKAAAQAVLGRQRQLAIGDDVNSWLVKGDWILNSKHNLSARYSWSRNNQPNGNFGVIRQRAADEANFGTVKAQVYVVNAQLTSVLSATSVNEFRFNVTREGRPRTENAIPGTTTVNGISNGAQVVISGIGTLGAPTDLPANNREKRYQFADSYSQSFGKHDVKFGIDVQTIAVFDLFRFAARGRFTFFNFDNFVAKKPDQFLQFFGSGAASARYGVIAGYGQDSYRIRKGLTANYGLRWEGQLNQDIQVPNADFLAGTRVFPDDRKMWSPRLGIVWDPRNDGAQVVRGFASYLYALTPTLVGSDVVKANGDVRNGVTFFTANPSSLPGLAFNDPFEGPFLTPLSAFPNSLPITQGTLPGSTVNTFDSAFHNPRIFRTNVTYERRLLSGMTAAVTYDYAHTTGNQRLQDLNLFPPAPDPVTGRLIYNRSQRPLPNAGFVVQRESTAVARYNAVTASLKKRFGHHLEFQAFYTWSRDRSDDDNERENSARQGTDPFNHKQDYGRSSNDGPHNFVANWVYELPVGFQVSGIFSRRSGFPFDGLTGSDSTVQSVATGISPSALANFRTRLGDPNATVFVGGNGDGNANDRPIVNGKVLPRNFFRNAPFTNLDLRIAKSFKAKINEAARIQVLADFFNVFNNSNFVTTNTVVTNPSFGQPNQPGFPFGMQLGLRFTF